MPRLSLLAVLLAVLCAAAGAQEPPATPSSGTVASPASAAASAPVPPPRPLTLSERANIMMARKEYYAAVDLLKEDLDQHPRDASLANRIGIAYQMLNQPVNAARYYSRAIHRNRHMAQPYNNLGTIYYDERNYGKALKLYHHAIHLSHGKVATYYVNAGTAEFMRKRFRAAGKDYLAALRIDPHALDPTRQVGSVLQDSSVTHPARYHFFLCRLYCEFGNLTEAMHQFRQALELDYPHLGRMCHDPVFRALIALPAFQTAIAPPPPGAPQPPITPGLKVLPELAACRLPPPTRAPAKPAAQP